MCGRFTLKTPPIEWNQLLLPLVDSPLLQSDWQPRYNIAPTQNILAVYSNKEENRALGNFRWGLVPFWSKDLAIGNRMINARSETIHEKRSFSGALKKRRCMIIADGYYEWQKLSGGKKQPCWISPSSGGVVLLAGLWEKNSQACEETIQSCTIITTAANTQLASIHDRMPVALEGPAVERWMSSDLETEEALSLLNAAEDGFFQVRSVSTLVNNPRNDSPECLA